MAKGTPKRAKAGIPKRRVAERKSNSNNRRPATGDAKPSPTVAEKPPVAFNPSCELPLPDYCGPTELIEISRLFRGLLAAVRDPSGDPAISEAAELRLAYLCAAASLLKEEGVGVTCALHVSGHPPTKQSIEWTTYLKEPVELADAEAIRKIARACPLRLGALVIEERGEKLLILGIQRVRRDHELTDIGSPLRVQQPHLNGMSIVIWGPGHLTLHAGHPSLELRAGRLHMQPRHLTEHPIVKETFKRITASLFGARVNAVPAWEANAVPGPPRAQYMVTDTWQRVATAPRNKNHGAAFVIATKQALEHIKLKYPVRGLQLGQALVTLWDRSFDAAAAYTLDQYRDWRDAASRVKAYEDQVVALSSIDGAVIFDQKLNVVGFGARLLTDARSVDAIRCVDASTGAPDPTLPARIRRLGTRHSSAFEFCCAHDGTLAFVVSQDGDLRIFVRNSSAISLIEVTAVRPSLAWLPDALASLGKTRAYLAARRNASSASGESTVNHGGGKAP